MAMSIVSAECAGTSTRATPVVQHGLAHPASPEFEPSSQVSPAPCHAPPSTRHWILGSGQWLSFCRTTTAKPLSGQSAELLFLKVTGSMARSAREKTSAPSIEAVVDIERSPGPQVAVGVTGGLEGAELAAAAVPEIEAIPRHTVVSKAARRRTASTPKVRNYTIECGMVPRRGSRGRHPARLAAPRMLANHRLPTQQMHAEAGAVRRRRGSPRSALSER